MPVSNPVRLDIRRKPGRDSHLGLLSTGQRVIPCRIGRSAISSRKLEGDGATPAGRMRVLDLVFMNAAWRPMRRGIGTRIAAGSTGWCDDPRDSNYNRPVKLPFSGSHEVMDRKDGQYDICLVLDWNFQPRIRNRGSAIFLHLVAPNRGPTQGCIALDPSHMRYLLELVRPGTEIQVHP